MKRDMTITYVVENALYINVTNRCTNNCEFCIRKNGDGAYGSDSLWLKREPTEEEIQAEYDKMAEAYKMEVEKVKEIIPEDSIKEDLGVQLAMKHVKDNAVIK